MAGGCCCEVFHLLEEAGDAARWHWLHLYCWRCRIPRPRRSRVCGVVNVYRPLVAVLRHDAWHDFFKRVATLFAASLEVDAVASDHGSGFPTVNLPITVVPSA